MSATFSTIFFGVNLTMRISGYLSLTDSMSSRISRLEKMHQKSAKAAFEDALRTNDNTLKRRYILRAIDKYRDASGVETDDEALFGVYVGLACCHGMLNDIENRNAAITKALDYYDRVKCYSQDTPIGIFDQDGELDETGEKIIKGISCLMTIGVGNIADYIVRQINASRINSIKESEKGMRDIAEQLRAYI